MQPRDARVIIMLMNGRIRLWMIAASMVSLRRAGLVSKVPSAFLFQRLPAPMNWQNIRHAADAS